MVQAPIFHVNGDDPDAVLHATQVALDFRQQFKKDVVIDLVCYRRRGHNEADEPSGTQPLMYQKIRSHPSARELYAKRLVDQGVLSEEEAKAMIETYREDLMARSEEHTSELQSRPHLVCRLLLEKKKNYNSIRVNRAKK